MSTQVQVRKKHDLVEEYPHDGDARTETALERITSAEQKLRIRLEYSVNPAMTFDLSPEEAEALRGRTLSEAIESLLEHTDPLIADSIRQTLTDPAALIEVAQQPARPDERIDPFIEQREEVSLGVSRAMRGGRGQKAVGSRQSRQ